MVITSVSPEQVPEEHERDVLVLGAVDGEAVHVDDLAQVEDLPVHVLVGALAPLRCLGALLEMAGTFEVYFAFTLLKISSLIISKARCKSTE